MNKVVCYAHPEAHLIEDYRAGDMICSECGLVVGDRVIDVGSEWRTFNNEKSGVDPSRVGGPENPLLSGGDLSTMIGPATGSASFDGFGSMKMHLVANNEICIYFGIIPLNVFHSPLPIQMPSTKIVEQ